MISRVGLTSWGVAIAFVAACSAGVDLPAVQDGDIIFQTSMSSQSVAIQRATHSKYSHMGLIVVRDGASYVLEASATVRYTPLKKWIERGAGHHFELKRLRDGAAVLTPEHISALHEAGARFLGRSYDLTFDWSDERIYCSELVYKVYDRALGIKIGELQRVRDFDLTDVAVQAKMQERYGSELPLDAPVISPVAMEQSPLLVTVVEQ
jgi:hypothetical protein